MGQQSLIIAKSENDQNLWDNFWKAMYMNDNFDANTWQQNASLGITVLNEVRGGGGRSGKFLVTEEECEYLRGLHEFVFKKFGGRIYIRQEHNKFFEEHQKIFNKEWKKLGKCEIPRSYDI